MRRICWVVGRVVEGEQWHLQGVADNEEKAIDMCRDKTYFIGPVVTNEPLPHDSAEWVGCYYPLA